LHLLTLERHQRLLRVVEIDDLWPPGGIVKDCVVLLDEGLADGFIVGIQCHLALSTSAILPDGVSRVVKEADDGQRHPSFKKNGLENEK